MAGFEIFLNETETQESELPLFKEMAIDFETGEPIIENNEIVTLEGSEALKVWIWRALKTERYKYKAYSNNYGNELKEQLGTIYDKTIKDAILENEIRECLGVNPYIVRLHSFSIETPEGMQHPYIYFSVDTVYGTIENMGVDAIGL
ncbi:DUF2634 domain-containing protein [Fusobacterium ulcerans]|uniref:DUF2634 domain-containing protein n=1 Tax=Fusobacterium ulcerans TaxID=861 RepID=UPI002E773283|nr:DUF2634 domain-containing protein [Fusobacterium ulcerans]MEE0139721.1 DUF2634 domain-containing protein [Fusobacterium ulcerans]